MANIFLTSSLSLVAADLAKHIDKNTKKLLFITTASENDTDDKWWLIADRKAMTDLGYELEDYTITNKTAAEVTQKLTEVDGLIMEGGNTFYLLQQIQQSKSANIFKQFVKSGKYYIGSSAGSMVAGPDIYTSREKSELAEAPLLDRFEALGITDINIQPHWGSDHFRESYLNEVVPNLYTPNQKIILLTDTQYIIIENQNIQIVDVNKN